MWKKIHVELKFLRLSSFTFKTRVLKTWVLLLLPHSVLLHSDRELEFYFFFLTAFFFVQTQRSSSVLHRQIVLPVVRSFFILGFFIFLGFVPLHLRSVLLLLGFIFILLDLLLRCCCLCFSLRKSSLRDLILIW